MLYSLARFAILLVLWVTPTASFAAPGYAAAAAPRRLAPLQMNVEPTPAASADCGCTDEVAGVVMPTGNTEGTVMVNDVLVSGATLRATELADVTGARATVSSVLGTEGKAVVVFLRHLG